MNQKSNIQQIVEDQSFILRDKLNPLEFHIDGFYDFLINPKTKCPLQLDILFVLNKTLRKNKKELFKPIRLAIEVQGKQHYQWSKNFHRNKSQFHYLQYRDKIKRILCQQNGIILVSIKYTDIRTKFNLKNYLLSVLPALKCHDGFLNESISYVISMLKREPMLEIERMNAFVDFLSPNVDRFEDNILDCLNETLTTKKDLEVKMN